MKKRMFWRHIPFFLLAFSLGIGGTNAFQTAFSEKINTIQVGKNETEVGEEFPSPSPIPPDGKIEYEKKVWVTNPAGASNSSNVPCYVRASISYSNSDIGQAVTLKNLDTVNWTLGSDGFYYYKKILSPGEKTSALFTGFSIDTSKIEKTYMESIDKFEVMVYEESVQSEGFSGYQAAWQAFGSAV